MMTNTEMKTYDLGEALRLFEDHYGKEKTEALKAYFGESGRLSNDLARDAHLMVEMDLLNQPRELLENIQKILARKKEYDRRYGRSPQPRSEEGRLRARVREEVYVRGIDVKAIDTAMGMPVGWFNKAVNQRGGFKWMPFYHIARALEISW